MKTRKRVFVLIALVVIGVSLGALREFIFINLNYWIDHVLRNTNFIYAHSFFDFLEGSSLGYLKTLKWIAAIVFILLMFFYSIACIEVFFNDRSLRVWVLMTFLGATIVSAAFLGLHSILAPETAMLSIAVKAFHSMQYPFFVLILIPAISLFKGTRSA